METSIVSAGLTEEKREEELHADLVSDVMANEAIKSISGFSPRSEEEAEKEGEATSSTSSYDAGVGTQSLPSYRTIDSWELDDSAYICEGNTTLVVSLPHERKVLRFRKSDEDNGDAPAEDGGKMRAEMSVHFFKNTISGLMGRHANEPEIVRCNPEDVARLMSRIETQRPEHRRHKKVVETFATMLPDYTLLPGYLRNRLSSGDNRPTFCVEIKPKFTFLDIPTFNRSQCYYCLHQHFKYVDGKISLPSEYCPIDLFCVIPDRMRRAVRGLAKSPQNNFRIFKNGRLIWGDGFEPKQLDNALAEWFFHDKPFDREAAHEMMFKLIYEALLRSFTQEHPHYRSMILLNLQKQYEGADFRMPEFGETHVPPRGETFLPKGSVLERILLMQRLDDASMSWVDNIYRRYSSILNDEMIYLQTKILKDENSHESKAVPSTEELLVLRNYIITRIAVDCSILIAFHDVDVYAMPFLPTDNIIGLPMNRYFLFEIAVTDLDPKSVHSIANHYRRYRDNDVRAWKELPKLIRCGERESFLEGKGLTHLV